MTIITARPYPFYIGHWDVRTPVWNLLPGWVFCHLSTQVQTLLPGSPVLSHSRKMTHFSRAWYFVTVEHKSSGWGLAGHSQVDLTGPQRPEIELTGQSGWGLTGDLENK